MSWDRKWKWVRRVLLTALVSMGITRLGLAVENPTTSNVRLSESAGAAAVRRAVRGAQESLGASRCQGLFSDFQARTDESLQSRLAKLGETGQSYLRLVLFYDGAGIPACRANDRRAAAAVTMPNSRVVFICGARFEALRRHPFQQEAAVIHETLHSLGLEENPPSSAEITRRIVAACAR